MRHAASGSGKLGQQTAAESHSVVIATGQITGEIANAANQTTGNASLASIDSKSTRAFSTPANTRPTVTTTSSIILAANSNRKYAYIFNQSGAVVYLKFGTTAVANEGIRLVNNDMFEITNDKLWAGDVHAIRGAGSGAVEVFEGT